MSISILRNIQRGFLAILRAKGYSIIRMPAPIRREELIDRDDYERVSQIISTATRGARRDVAKNYTQPGRVALYYEIIERWFPVEHKYDARHRILDVGSYHGYLLRLVHRRFPEAQLYGTEIHDECVSIARQVCPSATIWHGNVDVADEAAPYDAICLSEVMEHLVDPAAMAKHLVAMLRSGGRAVFTVPDGRYDTMPAYRYFAEHDSYAGHINFWSPESWEFFWARHFPDYSTTCERIASGHLIALIKKP